MSTTALDLPAQQWEYHYLEHRNARTLYEQIAALGLEGWELVSVIHKEQVPKVGIPEQWVVFLKRPCRSGFPA